MRTMSAAADKTRGRKARWRRIGIAGLFLAAALQLPLAVHLCAQPIRFNQFMIQKLELRYGTISAVDLGRMLRSAWSSGVDILAHWPSATPPDFEDQDGMLSHVFA